MHLFRKHVGLSSCHDGVGGTRRASTTAEFMTACSVCVVGFIRCEHPPRRPRVALPYQSFKISGPWVLCLFMVLQPATLKRPVSGCNKRSQSSFQQQTGQQKPSTAACLTLAVAPNYSCHTPLPTCCSLNALCCPSGRTNNEQKSLRLYGNLKNTQKPQAELELSR